MVHKKELISVKGMSISTIIMRHWTLSLDLLHSAKLNIGAVNILHHSIADVQI